MSAVNLLQNHLSLECPHIHSTRLQSIMDIACALQKSKRLTLTSLGRNINSKTDIKHKIKKVDRLESNKHLHQELNSVYQGLSKYVFKYINTHTGPSPIVVDLCYIQDNHDVQMLSAELATKGRTLPLYREVFAKKDLKGRAKSFLSNLFKCIPADKKVVIIMDSGFGEDWFKAIENLNWFWLVRARRGKSVKAGKNGIWLNIEEFIPLISGKAKEYKDSLLSKKYQRLCRIITKSNFSEKTKRKRPEKLPRNYNSGNGNYSKSNREPWILVTNLPSTYKIVEVIKYYRKRMQIEESFRDVKSHQFGLSGRYVKTKSIDRWGVKMLLAAIVQITLWIIGIIGHSQSFQKKFQANTVKNKKIFSYFFLGQLIIEHNKLHELVIDYDNIVAIVDEELSRKW